MVGMVTMRGLDAGSYGLFHTHSSPSFSRIGGSSKSRVERVTIA